MKLDRSCFTDSDLVLGIDAGSVSVGMVVLNKDREILQSRYEFHRGDIPKTVTRMLDTIDLQDVTAVAATDQTTKFINADYRCDDQVAVIAAAKYLHPHTGSVLHVGGEKFLMLFFNAQGEYSGLKTNTSCAAGTGGFLDQQAGRLNLSGINELAEIAASNSQSLPKIASRCSVFAKTDLIHAQQEGYSLSAICDGLCLGLAANIANTLFKNEQPRAPVIFCGGVARNQAVVRHISLMLGSIPVVDDLAHLYGALGAAFRMLDESMQIKPGRAVYDVISPVEIKKKNGHPPLELSLSSYPDFDACESFEYHAQHGKFADKVEVDIYSCLKQGCKYPVYLGLDIGSTSTKAVLMTPEKEVLSGFYTRTAGRPVEAMCSLLEAVDALATERSIVFEVLGMGTTGSGRKFIGRLAGADLILDEITAHARAAVELNPEVDTIIEIGGQDSKFTTLNKGRVTFSIMNNVCAAGTGSFIEEQAERLGVEPKAYAGKTMGVASPIASDRCTVFMERDINYYLSCGYSVNEVLAAALHSVRENYLNKVAVENSMGNIVCFQGATAKNRALVAAFEHRLERPIHVSPFCHLTGALGVALMLREENITRSSFRGMKLFKEKIPVRSETCDICANHCKITVADMDDGPVAFGFLCGRDYRTKHFVDNNRSGFDLIRTHKGIFPHKNLVIDGSNVTVGIPSALYLREDISMWVDFFNQLGIMTITGEDAGREVLQTGKKRAGAEFCSPIAAMLGQAAILAEKCDFIFLPHYLDNQEGKTDARRQYCYYSQYIPSMVAGMDERIRDKLISPMIKYLYSSLHQRLEIYRAAVKINSSLNVVEIIRAFEKAKANLHKGQKKWRKVFELEYAQGREISVMLLGRPYTVLSPAMNKKIPAIFAALGIKTFFQDMLNLEKEDEFTIKPFLDELHWNYAADIIKAAEIVAGTPGLYPVLMTSFNCSPDSFIREAFQKLMEGSDKPYLILEMDEHGSSVGYETRIEAAIRSFRNHDSEKKDPLCVNDRFNPVKIRSISDKIILFPNWDPLTCPLLVANLQREGLDARLLDENQDVIKRSMRLNSGQCIPINAIAQEFVEHVMDHDLNPEQTVLWMAYSEIACNIRLYPYKLKQMISSFGGGLEKSDVYTGNISFADISIKAAMNAYFAFMFGGLLRRMGCRIRPYEKHRGVTNLVIEKSLEILKEAFLGNKDKESAVSEVVDMFEGVETVPGKTIHVAIFGDLYVRDNPMFNQELIRFIEDHGGEVVTTPYSEYVKMIAPAYFRKWFAERKYLILLGNRTLLETMVHREKAYYRQFSKILNEPQPVYDVATESILARFNLIPENNGESMDNILKLYYIKKYHPEVSLFVQTSPSFCCPSLVTESMVKTIEEQFETPVVSITYDGTGGDKNRKIIPYLEFAAGKSEKNNENSIFSSALSA